MSLSKSKIFLLFCLSFILGVYLGNYINYEIMAVAAMVFVIAGTVWWSNRTVLIFAIAGVVVLLGAWRFQVSYSQNDIKDFYDQKITGEAVIVEEPDVRADKTYLTLGHVMISGKILDSKVLATVGNFPEYEYGQKISFEGKIGEPKEFPDFNYKNYLSRFGIDAVVYYPKVNVLSDNSGNKIKSAILKIKKLFIIKINEALPEPKASFLGGLLLGARRAIPQDLTDQFNRTGTSHIVAVSGYNITIIIGALGFAFGIFRKRTSFVLSLLAIVLFVVMTGASASVIRAGIMGGLTLIALNIGRLNQAGNALSLAAVGMLIVNPQILQFDVGFQLSFAALLGLIYFTPLIEKYFSRVPGFFRQYLLATISAQVFTLPILLFNFGLLSLVSIPANILVLPVVPITMLFGFLTGIAGLIWAKLALPFAGISWLLLTYVIKVIGFLAGLPFAAINFKFNFVYVLIYYTILGVLFYFYYRRMKRV